MGGTEVSVAVFACLCVCVTAASSHLDRQNRDVLHPAYIGCYVDGGPGKRLMQGFHQDLQGKLTPDICNSLCFEKGFAFSGTQYSYECFCSRTQPSNDKKSGETSECNAKCAGDQSKICGGSNRLSVYSTGITFQQATNDNGDYKYVGCFRDFSNGTRYMKGYHQDFPGKLTYEICIKVCRNKGFHYAGMEYGQQCFCDNTRPSYKHFAKDQDCSIRCEGNALQICGGNWKISIFETGTTGPPKNNMDEDGDYVGCFEDKENPRALSGHFEEFENTLTHLKCTGLCYSMGFLYAGSQYGKQCYCGDEHPNPNSKVSENECSKPCSGDPIKKCGGDYRNSVRSTGIPDIPVHEKYLGCFDDYNNRILKGLKTTFEKNNSPKRCTNYCRQLGFKYSGVEYGLECFCGNEEPSSRFLVSGDECNTPCSGDPLDTCGAGWRLAVYSTDLTESVVPLIQPPTSTTASPNKLCQATETTVNGVQACKGDIIFEEKFDTPLGRKWKNVVKIAEAPDFEFTVFQNNPKNCFVSKNKLVIKPTLYDDNFVQNGYLELEGCTGAPGTRECGFKAISYNILPPVVSARVNTHSSFSFRYGIVEIKAKLPVGDWLVPELYLEPKSQQLYGPDYQSGRIRIAMSRGNEQLECGGQDLSRTHLESGVLMGPDSANVKSRSVYQTVPTNWHDYFHTYKLIWKPDSISFKVDNELEQALVPRGGNLCQAIGFTNEECTAWSIGTQIAPFDTDFYISLGLSVGNARDFPDTCNNRGQPKPWQNNKVKSMLNFWMDKENWSKTWTDEKSSLYIEHVKVTAL